MLYYPRVPEPERTVYFFPTKCTAKRQKEEHDGITRPSQNNSPLRFRQRRNPRVCEQSVQAAAPLHHCRKILRTDRIRGTAHS